jgi:sirohydrochlorin ferrochelatase
VTQALLIVAHGSRREASNQEVRQLTERVRVRAGPLYSEVACAFLELAEPSILEGIHNCIANGADHLLVLPYFLSAGRHVSQDIPKILARAREIYPGVVIDLAPYLGAADAIPELLLTVAEQQGC